MQGMADPDQITTGVESEIYARAFVIRDLAMGKIVAIVVAEILAGMEAVKLEVVKRLRLKFESLYGEDNLLISGTHTHSAPGGFSHSKLYEHVTGGFNPHTFECIVVGIVDSICQAHHNLAPGKIYLNRGTIADCGRQRSPEAYLNNPASERAKYDSDTDKEMLLLKFVRRSAAGEIPIGVLNWYGIHPTDRGQKNTLVNGDHKGYAADLFERSMQNEAGSAAFVAAFANSSCGDVSGNVEFGRIPNGIDDYAHMQLHGEKQFNKAQELFVTATEELQGDIDYQYTKVDMSQVQIDRQPGKRTYPGALGLSFTTGSTEDSIPRIKVGKYTFNSVQLTEGLVRGQLSWSEKLARGVITVALGIIFGRVKQSQEYITGHFPKPIVLATGLTNSPITPNILPLQTISLGNLVLAAIPGEITTMAGRRLKETILNELEDSAIDCLALATYANDYALYITTKEEYEKQHYEGAATLFGPYTLMAYQQEFKKLAQALKHGDRSNYTQDKLIKSAPIARSLTIRNLSDKSVELRFFAQSDRLMLLPFLKLRVEPQSDRYIVFPNRINIAKARIERSQVLENIKVHKLIEIAKNGTGRILDYQPASLETGFEYIQTN